MFPNPTAYCTSLASPYFKWKSNFKSRRRFEDDQTGGKDNEKLQWFRRRLTKRGPEEYKSSCLFLPRAEPSRAAKRASYVKRNNEKQTSIVQMDDNQGEKKVGPSLSEFSPQSKRQEEARKAPPKVGSSKLEVQN